MTTIKKILQTYIYIVIILFYIFAIHCFYGIENNILENNILENNVICKTIAMQQINERYKEMIMMYKNLLENSLFNFLYRFEKVIDLEKYLKSVEYKEIKKLIDNIIYDEKKLEELLDKKNKSIEKKNKQISEYGEYSLLVSNEYFTNTEELELNDEQYNSINNFIYLLNQLKNICKYYYDINYYNSSDFELLLEKKMESSESNKNTNPDKTEKKKINFIYARISDLTLTRDKHTSKIMHIKKDVLYHQKNKNKFYDTNKIVSDINNNLNLNLRDNLIGSVSTFFAKDYNIFGKLMINFDRTEYLEEKKEFLNNLIRKLRINCLFIVFKDVKPIFNRINLDSKIDDNNNIKQKNVFGVNILSLNDLCLLMSTLKYNSLYSKYQTKTEREEPSSSTYILDSLKRDIKIKKEMILNQLYNKIADLFDIKNGLFIFIDLTWPDILEHMYKHSIELSGGLNVKRHMLNNLELSLSLLLDKFDEDIYLNTVKSFDTNKSLFTTNIDKANINKIKADLLKINKLGIGFYSLKF